MAAFAEGVFVKLHKDDCSSHNPSRESTVGSWYCQQGLQKGHEAFSDYFESSDEVIVDASVECLASCLSWIRL